MIKDLRFQVTFEEASSAAPASQVEPWPCSAWWSFASAWASWASSWDWAQLHLPHPMSHPSRRHHHLCHLEVPLRRRIWPWRSAIMEQFNSCHWRKNTTSKIGCTNADVENPKFLSFNYPKSEEECMSMYFITQQLRILLHDYIYIYTHGIYIYIYLTILIFIYIYILN